MTAVVVAIITSIVGPTLLYVLTKRDSKKRIGTPNGEGNVIQMMEGLRADLRAHTEQDDRNFREVRSMIGGGTLAD